MKMTQIIKIHNIYMTEKKKILFSKIELIKYNQLQATNMKYKKEKINLNLTQYLIMKKHL